jgi:Domain of Unknown Function with PDB structure (DUF3857)
VTKNALFLSLLLALPAFAQRTIPPEFVSWLPVTPEERAQKNATVEKDAGAEILLWRVHVLDEVMGSDLHRSFYHYIRMKIFDDKGKEKASTIDLKYREPGAILNIAARTIKPDGTIVELDKKSIFRRDIAKQGKEAEKSVSFAMPALEPGSIIEYRYQQTEDDNRFRYTRLRFQQDFPVRKVTYFVHKLDSRYIAADEEMFLLPIHCTTSPIKREDEVYESTTVENVPAAKNEPLSPSRPNTEPWALLYYRSSGSKDPRKFWTSQGQALYKEYKDALKVNDEAKSASAAALNGATTEDEKVNALIAWLHKNIRSVYDGEEVTDAERTRFFERLPKERNRTSAEIIKSGMAMPREMSVAFGALATPAGIDVRPAWVGDRNEAMFPAETLPDKYFLDNSAVAIKSGEAWKMIDLGRKFVTPGMLPNDEENVPALIGDPKNLSMVYTAVAAPTASSESRIALLKLSAEGTLEGDVTETLTGHRAEERRRDWDKKSADQQKEAVHDTVTHMFADAEVTSIRIENVTELAKPVQVHYHLKAPLYAGSTGKRILFQAMPFRRGDRSPFTASERQYPVQFPYPWNENDQIHIQVPDGFTLDHPATPGDVEFGRLGSYKVKMSIVKTDGETELFTTRDFTFGANGQTDFPAQSYSTVKQIFNDVQVRDGHSMSLLAQ